MSMYFTTFERFVSSYILSSPFQNFCISGRTVSQCPSLIKALAYVKKAAALANAELGVLPKNISKAICAACDELLAGKLHDQFMVGVIQGGAGTSTNMNTNEVIANRAIEILGGTQGDYTLVNPNDHVNRGQSTNDVYPSCGRMTQRSSGSW